MFFLVCVDALDIYLKNFNVGEGYFPRCFLITVNIIQFFNLLIYIYIYFNK